MRPAIGTSTGGDEDICSGQRLGKRSPGSWAAVGVESGANTYPVKSQGLRECGRASKQASWQRSQRGCGAWAGGRSVSEVEDVGYGCCGLYRAERVCCQAGYY